MPERADVNAQTRGIDRIPVRVVELRPGQVKHAADVRAAQPHRPVGREPVAARQDAVEVYAIRDERLAAGVVERGATQVEPHADAGA